jgi:hypothetical protein
MVAKGWRPQRADTCGRTRRKESGATPPDRSRQNVVMMDLALLSGGYDFYDHGEQGPPPEGRALRPATEVSVIAEPG